MSDKLARHHLAQGGARPRFAVAFGLLCLGALSLRAGTANDYTVIESLPNRLRAAIQEGEKGGDLDNSAKLLTAAKKYDKTLLAMIRALLKKYPHKAGISESELNDYVTHFTAADQITHQIGGGEKNETRSQLGMVNRLGTELEKMVAAVVVAVTRDDTQFDYQAWKKKWEAAKDSGD